MFMKYMLVILILVATATVAKDYKYYLVLSGSMEPLIPTGSMILVVPKESYEVGDLVTFNHHNKIFTHQIIDSTSILYEKLYYTKGTANVAQDPVPITHDEIVGVVVYSNSWLPTIIKSGLAFNLLFGFSGFHHRLKGVLVHAIMIVCLASCHTR